MDIATKTMVRLWVASDGAEKAAKFMAKVIHAPISECRKLVAEALA